MDENGTYHYAGPGATQPKKPKKNFSKHLKLVALCLLAALSAGEELAIQCLSREFDPNIRSILHIHDQSEKEINS